MVLSNLPPFPQFSSFFCPGNQIASVLIDVQISAPNSGVCLYRKVLVEKQGKEVAFKKKKKSQHLKQSVPKEKWEDRADCVATTSLSPTFFLSLAGVDPLEKEMATHSSICAWPIS